MRDLDQATLVAAERFASRCIHTRKCGCFGRIRTSALIVLCELRDAGWTLTPPEGIPRAEGVLSFRGTPAGAVQGGCLCFEGTRIPVDVILHFLDGPDDDEAILRSYPSLTQLDLDAARWFDAKWQVRRRRVKS